MRQVPISVGSAHGASQLAQVVEYRFFGGLEQNKIAEEGTKGYDSSVVERANDTPCP